MAIKLGMTYYTGRTIYAIVLDTNQSPTKYYNTSTNEFEDYSGVDNTYAYFLTEGDCREYAASISPILTNENYTIKIYEQVGSSPYMSSDIFLTARDIPYSAELENNISLDDIYMGINQILISGITGSGNGSGDLEEVLKFIKAVYNKQ